MGFAETWTRGEDTSFLHNHSRGADGGVGRHLDWTKPAALETLNAQLLGSVWQKVSSARCGRIYQVYLLEDRRLF